jgi:hypothetical protein
MSNSKAYLLSALASLVVLLGGDRALFNQIYSLSLGSPDLFYIGYVLIVVSCSVFLIYIFEVKLSSDPRIKYAKLAGEMGRTNFDLVRKVAGTTRRRRLEEKEGHEKIEEIS